MDFLEIDKSDIKSVCLICFNAKHELHQLKTNPTVIELLQMFFKFEVIKPDNFCICQNCLNNLIDSWNFIYLTDNSLNMLRSLLQKSKGFIRKPYGSVKGRSRTIDFTLFDFKCSSCVQKLDKSFILRNVYKHNLPVQLLKCSKCKIDSESSKSKAKNDLLIEFINVTNIKNEVHDDENVGIESERVSSSNQIVNQSVEDALSCDTEVEDVNDLHRPVLHENGTLCSLCDSLVEDWNFHMRQVHMSSNLKKRNRKSNKDPKGFKCSECSKWLKSRSSFTNHQRTHTGERPFVCNYCGKGFAQNSSLKTHMNQHTGRPNKCDICEKSFCRPSELKLHLQKHSGDKPHLCNECGKSFGQKSHLTAHLNIHKLDRPHKCSYCDKNFKDRSTLKMHEDTHKQEKRFQCDKCSYKCNRMYRLNEHKKYCTVGKNDLLKKCHNCCACEKGFTSTASLKYHMTNEHHVVV